MKLWKRGGLFQDAVKIFTYFKGSKTADNQNKFLHKYPARDKQHESIRIYSQRSAQYIKIVQYCTDFPLIL